MKASAAASSSPRSSVTDFIHDFLYIAGENGAAPVARFDLHETIAALVILTLLLASAFWAASIASARRHNAILSFVLVFCIFQNLSEYLYILVSCIVIFMLMSLFFRGADRAPFTAVLASNIACLIPPFLITLVLAVTPLIRVTSDNISTCFTVFFVIYLVIILLDRSVDVRLAFPGRRPPTDD